MCCVSFTPPFASSSSVIAIVVPPSRPSVRPRSTSLNSSFHLLILTQSLCSQQLTMSSSTSSHCVPSSFSRKLFLWLLPATVTLFTTIHQSPFAVASPFIPQKDDSVVVPMTSFGQPLPPSPLSLVPNPPLYFVFPENLPLERPFDEQNDGSEEELAEEAMGTKAKRAQTFVRFGKRAQTFVRFGKRAQTFVRLGRDTQRQFDGKMQSEQQQKKA